MVAAMAAPLVASLERAVGLMVVVATVTWCRWQAGSVNGGGDGG